MERKAGFIECPKCGLRNKPNAVQCDFCGQSLTAPDEWQMHVKDLESLTKVEYRRPVDEPTSRRIESTIIRKEPVHQKAVEVRELTNLEKIFKDLEEVSPKPRPVETTAPEPVPVVVPTPVVRTESPEPVLVKPVEIPVIEKPEEQESVKVSEEAVPIVQTPEPEPVPTVEVQPIPVVEPEVVVPTVEEPAAIVPAPTIPVPVKEAEPQGTAAPITTPAAKEKKAVPQPSARPIKIAAHSRDAIKKKKGTAIALLATGMMIYVISFFLSYLGTFDTLAGLSSGAVSSILIVFGVMIMYPLRNSSDSSMVFICPKCHETVSRDKDRCPACGAQFSYED